MGRALVCVNGIVRKDKKYLLTKRSKDPYKGMWALPGGKLENKETIKEGMLREIKEETGLDCEFIKINIIFHEMIKDGKDYMMSICTVEPNSFDFVESDEGPLKWFTDFPDDMIPIDKYIIENYEDQEVKILEMVSEGNSFKILE